MTGKGDGLESFPHGPHEPVSSGLLLLLKTFQRSKAFFTITISR
jgi:hypothetical protein